MVLVQPGFMQHIWSTIVPGSPVVTNYDPPVILRPDIIQSHLRRGVGPRMIMDERRLLIDPVEIERSARPGLSFV